MQSDATTSAQTNNTSSTRTRVSWPHIALALTGIGTSLWALVAHFRIKAGGDSGCGVSETFNCDAVLSSKYAQIAGVPLGVWGIAFFVFVLLLSTWKENAETAQRDRRNARLMQLMISAAGFGGSIILLYISKVVIGEWCKICLSTHAVTTSLFLLSLWNFWKLRRSENRSPVEPILPNL